MLEVWLRHFAELGWKETGPRVEAPPEVLQVVADVGEHVADLRAEDKQRGDDDDRNQGEQDAVFGHRLTLFAAELDLAELEPITEFHRMSTPLQRLRGIRVSWCCGRSGLRSRQTDLRCGFRGRPLAGVREPDLRRPSLRARTPFGGFANQATLKIPRAGYRGYSRPVHTAPWATRDG